MRRFCTRLPRRLWYLRGFLNFHLRRHPNSATVQRLLHEVRAASTETARRLDDILREERAAVSDLVSILDRATSRKKARGIA